MKILAFIALLILTPPEIVRSEPVSPESSPLTKQLRTELQEGFSTRFEIVGLMTQTEPRDTSLFNPKNQLIRFPKTELDMSLRPDFALRFRTLSLSLKPRLITNTQWSSHFLEDANTETSVFINEGRVQWAFSPSLISSYGREVLLWGPSYLFSPSNPFFPDNGRSNPNRELGGKDFLRMISIPNLSWTVSFISNLGEGREETEDDFDPIHAVKVDYTGQTYALSFNLSKAEGGRFQVGDYGQLTVSEAGLLYTEGSIRRGTEALYPQRAGNPLGWEMAATKKETDAYFLTELIGASYTLEDGPTLSIEYVYNQEGYSDFEAGQYDQLGREVSELFLAKDARSGLAVSMLGSALSPGLRLLRRNYLFFQLLETNIRDEMGLTLRYTHNLDDASWMFVPVVEWNPNDWIQLFALGTVQGGRPSTEFGRLIQYQAMVGTKLFLW